MIISISALVVIFFTGFLNMLFGIVVFIRNQSNALNRSYLAIALSVTCWTTASLLSDDTSNYELSKYASSLAFGFGFLAFVSLAIFSTVFKGRKLSSQAVILLIGASFILFALFSSPLVYDLRTIDYFESGPLYIPFIVTLVMLMGYSSRQFLIAYKRGDKLVRNQVRTMSSGILIASAGGLLFNGLLPVIYRDSAEDLTRLGPVFSVFIVVAMGFAIIRHKLFDFRAALARALVYAFVSLLVVSVYVAGAFLLKRVIFPDLQVTLAQLVSNILLAIILVVTMPRIRAYFDKLTSRIFFRDLYDPQTLIDEMNQVLVSNVDLDMLLTKTAATVNQYIKTSFCTFYIRPTAYVGGRVMGVGHEGLALSNLSQLHEDSVGIKKKVFFTDDENGSVLERGLAKRMRQNNINAFARLVNNVDLDVKGIGLMFLGAKRSGSPFDKQDLRILEIIANELVIAIENVLRYEEIDKFNVTLQQKIDDATRELRRTNEKLVALDEAKDEFVSMASHQLRTPLTSIKGYVSMVAEEDMGKLNTQQKKMLAQALFSSQRMVYLISDLLNVSRLKTGKFVIEPKPVHLPTVIESELSQLREGASAKDITLTYHDPKSFPILYLDEMKIRQVIMNFTDNAIYYTPNGGKITLALKETPQSIEFTVKDTGIGVPKDERHKLFTKFYRANNAKQARPDGTGLGLFMAKKVIIAQGGSVVFESVEGKGSTFGFNFPKDAVKVPDNVEVDKKKVMTSVGSEAMPEPSLED